MYCAVYFVTLESQKLIYQICYTLDFKGLRQKIYSSDDKNKFVQDNQHVYQNGVADEK